jgi:hypothetical protein
MILGPVSSMRSPELTCRHHSFVDRRRPRPSRDITEGVNEERIRSSPRKPGHNGCLLVS